MPVILCTLVILAILKLLVYQVGLPIGNRILSFISLILTYDLSFINDNLSATAFIGIVVMGGVIILTGCAMNNSLGRRIKQGIEDGFFRKLPLIRMVYPYAKQISNFFTGKDQKKLFKTVVTVEYPRKGIYSLGFLTSEWIKMPDTLTAQDYVTVFVPSSPTPFTGWTIILSRAEVLALPLTVDEALKVIVSGGILGPEHEVTPLRQGELKDLCRREKESALAETHRNIQIYPPKVAPVMVGEL